MRARAGPGARLAICGWARRVFKRNLDAVVGGRQERRRFTWSRAGFTIPSDSLGLARTGQAQNSCIDLALSCSSAHVMRPPMLRTNTITVARSESLGDRGLVTAWRLAPPATVQVVGGDSNPPPTPPSPLVHILTCPVPVAWQVNLPLHLLQVLFNASFYISHLLLAADRSRNRSRATAAAATCRRPRHRPCPASSRRAGTAARPAHPPRKAAAAGAIDTRAWCRAARGAVAAAVSLPRRRRRRRWTARMPGTVPVVRVDIL